MFHLHIVDQLLETLCNAYVNEKHKKIPQAYSSGKTEASSSTQTKNNVAESCEKETSCLNFVQSVFYQASFMISNFAEKEFLKTMIKSAMLKWVLLKPPTTDPPTNDPPAHQPLTHRLIDLRHQLTSKQLTRF